jgi:5-(carboxyamino)imidazole ribonucleotide mutase
MKKTNPLVGIIMGSDSDLSIMSEAAKFFDEFGISYELKVLSAHRSPEETIHYAKTAESRGLKTIIAAAGGAAHLAGVVASSSILPVIGVPIKSKSLDGLDSLFSIVQMPSGVPVATVAINGAKNAAILAAQIIGTQDKVISKKLIEFKDKIRKESLNKNRNLKF